ncbi:response regulator transcription factor [Ferroacidibacillus organovorans]|uniref:DNA-binding response regulator n=1 Tax=Ferroacidibacillus organovorans TaxID=1765683 RepID=A0A162TNQ4_9BACL|nr:response regulator transcription factor [Ferroacidibacillus organovorans]KYP80976.1 hypothetical protein AYJ22_09340 [Ferroacidibacillus organovorans]OAG93486.1 hypothetical protein AYW79_10435 [Ferroacidibacillus organovorans]OPG17302.1 DNA-binding response regulator [Ferroacidibacillus organovorans]
MRVLIVEDEKKLSEALVRLLVEEGISADVAYDGEDGYLLASSKIYDAIILDRMLPSMDGLSVLSKLRKASVRTPVLMLTARDGIPDRVAGLNAGADDYLVKPFATEELIARIRALHRRPAELITDAWLQCDNLRFDPIERTLMTQSGESEKLSPKEAQILELLMKHHGQVLTRRQLMDNVWGYEADVLEGVLDTYVHHLRKRLSLFQGPAIQTVRGVGYSLRGSRQNSGTGTSLQMDR